MLSGCATLISYMVLSALSEADRWDGRRKGAEGVEEAEEAEEEEAECSTKKDNLVNHCWR